MLGSRFFLFIGAHVIALEPAAMFKLWRKLSGSGRDVINSAVLFQLTTVGRYFFISRWVVKRVWALETRPSRWLVWECVHNCWTHPLIYRSVTTCVGFCRTS
jgi:hypothetical protein